MKLISKIPEKMHKEENNIFDLHDFFHDFWNAKSILLKMVLIMY